MSPSRMATLTLALGLALLLLGQSECDQPPAPSCEDIDLDGFGEGPDCLGPDCNDGDPAIFPGASELCEDGLDNDCDGAIDLADPSCDTGSLELALFPNFHTVGVTLDLSLTPDPEGDARTTLAYQALPDGPVLEGLPLSKVQGMDRLSGALLFLDPGAPYRVWVTVTDPTTPALNQALEGDVTTRADPRLHTPSRILSVTPEGAGSACSPSLPCALSTALSQVRAGETIELAGGIYRVGGLTLAQSGTADGPITLRSAPGERAIWDGSDGLDHAFSPVAGYPGMYVTELSEASANVNCVVADGVRLYPYRSLADLHGHHISCILATPQVGGMDGFYRDPREATTVPLAVPNPYHRKLYVSFADGSSPAEKDIAISTQRFALDVSGQSHIHLRDMTFRNYGVAPSGKGIVARDTGWLVVDGCDFEHNDRSITLEGGAHHITLQGSRFVDDTAWDTYIGKATYEPASPQLCYQSAPPPYPYNDRLLETGGIVYGHGFSGRGIVIRGNTFEGLMDGFKAVPPSVAVGYTTAEIDVYDNTVLGADDGMEVDGIAANVRVWGNRLHGCADAISLAPPAQGPVYVLRNIITDQRTTHATAEGLPDLKAYPGQPLKFDCPCTGGEVFFFHNTVVNAGDAYGLRIYSPTQLQRFVARNNILVSEDAYALYVITSDPALPPLELDYDLYFNAGTLANVAINKRYVDYEALEDVTAEYGYEPMGLNADPLLVDTAGGDYRLGAGSPALDAGVVIPGVNVGRYSGAAPDLGAIEGDPDSPQR